MSNRYGRPYERASFLADIGARRTRHRDDLGEYRKSGRRDLLKVAGAAFVLASGGAFAWNLLSDDDESVEEIVADINEEEILIPPKVSLSAPPASIKLERGVEEIDEGLVLDVKQRITDILTDPGRRIGLIRRLSRTSRFADYSKIYGGRTLNSLTDFVIAEESGGKIMALHPKTKAGGLMQIIPKTAEDLNLRVDNYVDQRFEPEMCIRAGCKYLGIQLRKNGGNEISALIAYNWGPANLKEGIIAKGLGDAEWRKVMRRIPEETTNYILDIFADRVIVNNLRRFKLTIPQRRLYSEGIRKNHIVQKDENLYTISRKYGISRQSMSDLNPHIKNDSRIAGETVRVPYV